MKETDKRVGAITNRFGEMVEYMVLPNLVEKFDELGFTFTKANRTEITDREHDIITEIDALLENGDTVMVVEIKTKPNTEDILDHIARMEKLRRYADLHNDKRKYMGAMAGVVFSESDKIYALKKGFYVIEPSGDTFSITEPKDSYYPHVW
jgi:Holliday junction resolvase-like predicted endonuclease